MLLTDDADHTDQRSGARGQRSESQIRVICEICELFWQRGQTFEDGFQGYVALLEQGV